MMNFKLHTIVGLIGTFVWLGFVFSYLLLFQSLEEFQKLSMNSVGDFVAGVTAPLAFWWLVLGYYQQGIELRQNVEALRQQSAETANLVIQAQAQADAVRANEQHAKRDLFFATANMIIDELRQTALFVAQKISDVGIEEWSQKNGISWNALETGFKDAPFYNLGFFIAANDKATIMGHIRNRVGVVDAIDHYIDQFTDLLRQVDAIAPNDMVLKGFFQGGRAAYLYEQFCILRKKQSAMRYS